MRPSSEMKSLDALLPKKRVLDSDRGLGSALKLVESFPQKREPSAISKSLDSRLRGNDTCINRHKLDAPWDARRVVEQLT